VDGDEPSGSGEDLSRRGELQCRFLRWLRRRSGGIWGHLGTIWGPSLSLNDTFSGGGAPVRFRVQLVQITPITMDFVGDIFQIFLISGDPKYPGKQYP